MSRFVNLINTIVVTSTIDFPALFISFYELRRRILEGNSAAAAWLLEYKKGTSEHKVIVVPATLFV